MRILILANKDIGLLSFRKEVVEALLNKGYSVTVSVPKGNRVNEISDMGCNLDIVDIDRRGVNPAKDVGLLLHYKRLVNKVQPDVVLSYTIKPNVYGGIVCAWAGIPYIPNITGLGSAVENPGFLQKITLSLYRYAMRKASCIFFQNTGNEQFLSQHGVTRARHRVIPGSGVNISRFSYKDYPSDEVTRFLFISRLMKEKGIEDYFSAAKYFRSIRNDVEFHILGVAEEDYSDELNELSANGTVVYHGQQVDVRPFITQSSCLIHPTFYPEGMSNVILESAASGRPVITTRRHGCMEAVDDGVTGYLFPERDRKSLFDAISRFLALPQEAKRKMGLNARRKMENCFDRKIIVTAYLEEIGSALENVACGAL